MNIKVAIVDDHRIVRDGLKAILRGMNGYEIVYEAADGARLKSIPQNIAPDLVLLDIGLPDVSGLDLIEFIKQQLGSRILVLTAEMDEEIICTSLERGADGFMNKDASGDELLRAMDAVVQGEPYFGQNLSSVIYRSYKRKINELKNIYGMPALTDREREIIQALGDASASRKSGPGFSSAREPWKITKPTSLKNSD
jgi:DNA-binding NarL/FixJ family response regulator